jgi:hypothetical protein
VFGTVDVEQALRQRGMVMVSEEGGVLTYVPAAEMAAASSQQPRRVKLESPGNGVGEGNAEVEVERAVVE